MSVVSLRAEYAVKAMLRLALAHGGEPVQAREIAAYGGIPSKFVEQVMHSLRSAELVRSVRGRAGGYVLARDPDDISFLDIVSAVEGSHGGLERMIRRDAADSLVEPVWRRVEETVREILASVSIADVAAGAVASPMYYI